ncbi:MAG: YbhB/YbcL family Raf kinase inhibitor-like protein [Oscillospiraceae bacterium]|nr:YbhB/YbcL family Raf kinase inhibitor-like protein [Oscillospiraceae bacterium]
MNTLTVSSPAFSKKGFIPVTYTADGENLSPPLELSGLCDNAKSIAVTMDDLSLPMPAYNHWLIWNLPVQPSIPKGIPHGESVPSLGGAMQGIGHGKHRYAGPKPLFRASHQYEFTVYVLDCVLSLPSTTKRRQLLAAMRGHILQKNGLCGHYY